VSTLKKGELLQKEFPRGGIGLLLPTSMIRLKRAVAPADEGKNYGRDEENSASSFVFALISQVEAEIMVKTKRAGQCCGGPTYG
jgi:hypothetical protein